MNRTILKSSLLSLLTAASLSTAFSTSAMAVPAHTRTAELLTSKLAHSAPSGSAQVTRGVSDHTPIYGAPTTLPVLGETGSGWLHVSLLGRPNGTTGWITSSATRSGTTAWVVRVSIPTRTVKVYRFGRLKRTMKAVIGSSITPTPTGHFFIVEKVPQPAGSSIGSWALALNGYSNVLHQFGGGPGQIAIHGIGDLGASPGEAASHGCVRVSAQNLLWLARHLSAGVTVTITGSHRATASAASYEAGEPTLIPDAMDSVFSNPFNPFAATE
jgi:lipoprotein-anchoring transpeptidase ErfK/SrfK